MNAGHPLNFPRHSSHGRGKSFSQNRITSQRGISPLRAFPIQNVIQRPPYRQRGRGGRYKENFDKRSPIDAASKIKVMESILQKEPYMIAIELLQKNSGYEVFLDDSDLKESKFGLSLHDTDLKVSKIVLVIKLLDKSLSSRANDEGAIDLLFITFKNANFCQNLMNFVSDMKFKPQFAKEYLPIVGSIIAQFIRLSPNNAFPILTNLVDLCRGVVIQLQRERLAFADSLVQIFDNIQTQMKETRSSLILAQKATDLNINAEEPPDDFRDHDVIPTCAELNVLHKPFLRPNKVQGRYKDSNHYLDVQFRLLKEDFIRPLRLGVQEYKKFHNKTKYKDARMYQNVTVDSTAIERNEFVYYLKLNLPKGLNIENSKRLMYGNILCISSDDFETLIVATIFGRDKLQNHLVAVKLETEPFQLIRNQKYTVIESKAYFVSYMHALKALQEVREVPLKKYIVEVEETNTPPDYLSRLSLYKQRRVIRNNNIKQVVNLEFKVLDSIDNWPSATMLKLDESQRQALYGALTRKMAIIQGPPGTGKTHLGLLITRILLENKENWNVQNSHPLLVVCFTNHALDQFLEGMLKFTDKICRVGSRSQNEALEEYQINKLMFSSRDINLVNDRYNVLKGALKEMQYVINVISKILKKIEKPGIINYDYFNGELGIVVPACFTPLIGMSMRKFLISNFVDNIKSENNKNDNKKEEESKNAESNEVNDADEEIIKEERNRMLVESDDEEEIQIETLHYEIVGLTKIPELVFEVTSADIEETISKYENHIKRKPLDVYSGLYGIQIEMLKREERAIKAGEAVTFTKDEIKDIEAKADMNLDFISRWKLYKYWRSKLSKIYQRKLSSLERSHLKLSKSMTSLKDLKYLNVMKNVDVVGMTTTGAAHYCKVLHDLAPPIVIVEEAAEILEAHIVASLSESCQHLILIGDHQQLRPKPEVYELSLHYHMDTSFFERMIRNNVVYHTLEYQHRMRPAISNLLVPTIYENLKDHRAVFTYPHIRGVKKDLFFVDHNVYEKDNNFEETESFQNPHEAEFLMGLCRYLLYQGYDVSDITIITPYFGQYRYLKQLQKKPEFQNCAEIRISVLDNYQGEESNIILLSLVRSNEERRIGFMKVDNRVNVALSRAKHGMFIIGNMSQMAESSNLWREIHKKLAYSGNIGPKMKLVCSNHPNEIMEVSSLEDFIKKTPKGGCSIPCTGILPGCGHKCPNLCHIIDKDHLLTKCTNPCTKKLCELGHQCPKLCYQKCEKCIAPVKKFLPCGHVHPVECSTHPDLFKCPTKVRRELPSCKHTFDLECHVDIYTYKCPMKCNTLLYCGNLCILNCHPIHKSDGLLTLEKIPLYCDSSHKCIKSCHEPLGSCNIVIDKLLNCGHILKSVKCGMPEKEMICIEKCQRTLNCKHKCQLACGVKCGNCMEMVEKLVPECKHKIKIRCSLKPDIRYCTNKCVKRLPCSHPCLEKCYQSCTSKCTAMVESKFKCQRKHRIKLIPCYLKKQKPIISELLNSYCTEICKRRLECGHFCEEKCNVPCPFNCLSCEERYFTVEDDDNHDYDYYDQFHFEID